MIWSSWTVSFRHSSVSTLSLLSKEIICHVLVTRSSWAGHTPHSASLWSSSTLLRITPCHPVNIQVVSVLRQPWWDWEWQSSQKPSRSLSVVVFSLSLSLSLYFNTFTHLSNLSWPDSLSVCLSWASLFPGGILMIIVCLQPWSPL